MRWGSALHMAWRLPLALALWTALALRFGPACVDALIPLVRWELSVLDSSFAVVELAQRAVGPHRTLQIIATPRRTLVVGTQVIFPDVRQRIRISTPSGHLLQPWVLAFGIACAWPLVAGSLRHRLRETVLRAALLCVTSALVSAVDIPLLLSAELWEVYETAFTPGSTSLLWQWSRFLEGGGRLALGLTAGAVAVAAAAALAARWHRRDEASPTREALADRVPHPG